MIFASSLAACLPGTAFAQTPQSSRSDAIIQFLERNIDWFHQLDVERQLATDAGDQVLVNENQQIAGQAIRLAFDYARAEAELLEREPGRTAADNTDSSRHQALLRLSATLDKQLRKNRAEVESLRQKLTTAGDRQRQKIQSQIAETQSEIDLAQARKDSLLVMIEFVAGTSANGLGASGLRARIETLARSVPAALTRTAGGKESAATAGELPYTSATVGGRKSEPSSVWDLGMDLIALSRKNQPLAHLVELTSSLSQATKEQRTPLVDKLRAMSRRSDDLANQADTADEASLEKEKKELDTLTGQFKLTSAAVLPLSKQGILLGLYERNLTEWQSSVRSEFRSELRTLLIRLALLAVFLAAVVAGAGLWRRTVFRYVQDARRRHQLLLVRKIALWFAIAAVLVFTFANELGSVATFAGLMTAGVALALQSVILSAAGYFFLIGRYGIRVGDRVQVSGVTGEVIDIGIVRFHVLELVSGGGKTPSGRVVAFPNSVVFQASTGLFKQIPGTNFVWHEITLSMSADTDYAVVEERLRGAVEKVFSEYREEMQSQYRQIEKTFMAVPAGEFQPRIRLRITQSNLEAVIRYPVDLRNAGEIDNRLTRELFEVMEREPKLRLIGAGGGGMKIRTDVTGDESTRS